MDARKETKDRRVLRLRDRAVQGEAGSRMKKRNVSVDEANGKEESSQTEALLLTATVGASCRQVQLAWG